jgi:alanyl-tRNA synthetase
LPKPSIDTGAGLERIASVLQGVISNYDTDLFTPLIKRAAEATGTSLKKELDKEAHTKSAASLRVIADHSRAATFLISDGVHPSNEGRGYVLRKIIRRAVRHGRLLGAQNPFMSQMVFAVRDLMNDAYPELVENADRVSRIVHAEETRFAHTLKEGLARFEASVKDAQTWLRGTSDENLRIVMNNLYGRPVTDEEMKWMRARGRMLEGSDAFKLYDTFGLPVDFMIDACRDSRIIFDRTGFDTAMAEQRERARAERDFTAADRLRVEIAALGWEVRDGAGGFELLPL